MNMKMQHGIRYRVTKPSKDRTFQAGDQIALHEDGSIINYTVRAWQNMEDVSATTEGSEVAVDREWASVKLKTLYEEIEVLQKAIQ